MSLYLEAQERDGAAGEGYIPTLACAVPLVDTVRSLPHFRQAYADNEVEICGGDTRHEADMLAAL
jgi:hypothetical protein